MDNPNTPRQKNTTYDNEDDQMEDEDTFVPEKRENPPTWDELTKGRLDLKHKVNQWLKEAYEEMLFDELK
ncbi:hypothetical protein C9374_009791 [Naegleria lovaniensis]|uniref:Uncharacterized protein n=1 Tax=Naegleria lovaniensis TaxID=51637 RepID=A0AA88H3Y8_NAELO|nr:uncharacterized protein C9374_009791 [Naegleria lovaniensis]KAG2393214.1 hypothetical protein C9374_009791 [Naegleria lovaniensis]